MPKTAAQIVPLKTQLAGSLALSRFADATTDFLASGFTTAIAGPGNNDFVLDNSGVDPRTGALLTGTALPVALATPATPTAGASAATGGAIRDGYVRYGLQSVNTGNISGPITWFDVFYPANGSTTGSVTINWTNPGGLNTIYIIKLNAQGSLSYTSVSGGASTFTDTQGQNGNFNPGISAAAATNYSSGTAPDGINPASITVVYNTNGGSWSTSALAYKLTAYNAIGESLPSTELDIIPAVSGPIIANKTMTAVTAAATTGGTLAANTYFYKVTVHFSFYSGSPVLGINESIPSAEVSVTTSSTGSVLLSWSAVANAIGYTIYRSTASGTETWLTTITGSALTSYTDTGALTPQTLRPPTTYSPGYLQSATQVVNWTAVPNATGYWLYRLTTAGGLVGTAYQFPAQATVTYTDLGTGGVSRQISGYNATTPTSFSYAGRVYTINALTMLTKIGFTFTGVPGKQYQFRIYNNNNGTLFTSPIIIPASSAPTYYEYTVNSATFNQSNTGYPNNFVLQAIDFATGGTISWPVYGKTAAADIPLPASWTDNGTQIGNALSNPNNYPQGASGAYASGNVPVTTEALASFPMKFYFRVPVTGQAVAKPANNLVLTSGTLLGGHYTYRAPNVVYTVNQTLGTPVKSIVPSSSLVAPTNPVSQSVFLNKTVTIEVSTDGGVTYTTVTLGVRFTFPTPATQMMFRITIPVMAHRFGPDASIDQGLPGVGSLFGYNNNTSGTTQTGGTWVANQDVNYGANDFTYYGVNQLRMGSNSGAEFGNTFAFTNVGSDVDFSAVCDPSFGNGRCGLRFRWDGVNRNPDNAYYFCVDNSGNWFFAKLPTYGSTFTTIASGTGISTGGSHLLRVVAVGSHILGYVDGRLVLDITDTTYAANTTNVHVGLNGRGSLCGSVVCIALTPANFGTNPPAQWELEYLAAYLET